MERPLPDISPPQRIPQSGGGWWRRLVGVIGRVMLGLGALLLAFVAYQLWGTSLYNRDAQGGLEQQFSARLATATTALASAEGTVPVSAVEVSELPQPALVIESAPPEGAALGRLVIPTADADDIMVEGVSREVLKKGPGHMPWTPLPGQPGNAVVSGHRTTYGAPFFYLDLVKVGDEIIVETAIGRHVFEVREILVVEPTDVWVTDPRPGAWLTLTTCTPRYSAAQRLVVAAELVDGPNLAAVEALVDLAVLSLAP